MRKIIHNKNSAKPIEQKRKEEKIGMDKQMMCACYCNRYLLPPFHQSCTIFFYLRRLWQGYLVS